MERMKQTDIMDITNPSKQIPPHLEESLKRLENKEFKKKLDYEAQSFVSYDVEALRPLKQHI